MMIAALKDKDNVFGKMAKVFVLLLVGIVLVMSMTTAAFAKEDDSDSDFSFYKISSAATAYYDDAHNPTSNDTNGFDYSGISMDKAGAFVGFIDEDYESGLIGSTISYLSGSSQSRSYDSFREEGLKDYVLYGHALSALGLDSTANETFDILSIVRFLGGLFLMLVYTTALSADAFFAIVISILKALNPFAWFMAGVSNVSSSFSKWFDTTPETPSVLDGVSQFITGWYTAVSDLGMYVVFLLFFLSLGAMLLMWNSQKGRAGSIFRTFATRLAFICVGIPLLGGLYTASLDLASQSSWGNNFTPAANQVIASTLVDFESWATNGHLALPDGVTITVDTSDSSSGVVDAGKSTSVRGIARSINSSNSSMRDTGYGNSWTISLKNSATAGSNNKILGAYDVMGRYMSSAFYHASDFETTYKSTKIDDESRNSIFTAIKDHSGKWKEYIDTPLKGNMFDNASEGANTPYFNDGSKESFKPNWSGKVVTFSRSNGTSGDSTNSGGTGSSLNGGLSSMSLYNYLSTSFGDSSVVTYSAHKATSGLVVQSHHSVNLIGDGMSSVLYWANAVIILFVITIIGLVYSLGLIINMIGRGIKMVSSVPFAMLGNMKAMAKVVTYTAMMIIEVLGTFFVYSLVIEILLSLSGIVETPLLEALSSRVGSTVLLGGTVIPGATAALPAMASTALVTVGLLVSSILYLWFGIKAIKLRKSIIKTIDEGVASLIDRIFTTNPQGGSMGNAQNAGQGIATAPTLGERAKNAGKQIAGGVAGGAAMAVGQSMMSGALGGHKDGVTAGSIKTATAGEAENAGGLTEQVDSGTGIEGADRQGLPGPGDDATGPDGLPNGPKGPLPPLDSGPAGEVAGRSILATNADSLGDIRQGDAADVPDSSDIKGIQAGADAQAADVKATAVAAEQMQDTKDVKPGDKKQLAADAKVDAMVGNTSAMEEDADAQAKRQVKADAAKDTAKGAAQTVKGVAEGAAAYATGDVQMGVDAVKDVAGGAKKMADGAQKGAHASENVDAVRAKTNEARAQATGSRSGVSAQSTQSRVQSAPASAPTASSSHSVGGHSMVRGGDSMSVKGGSSTNISNAGPTNVNVQPKTEMSPRDKQRLTHLQTEQRALERAREQVRRTGSATLPGGRIVHNTSDVNSALRANRTSQEKLKSGAVEKAGEVAKKALSAKTGGGDSL